LAEILYKVAFERSQVVGTNYGFLLLEKPRVQKEGISAKLLDKAANRPLDVLIGNRNLLQNYGIAVPDFRHNAEASTELFLAANEEVLMVRSPSLRSSCSTRTPTCAPRPRTWSPSCARRVWRSTSSRATRPKAFRGWVSTSKSPASACTRSRAPS
jgi:hypothetical protein